MGRLTLAAALTFIALGAASPADAQISFSFNKGDKSGSISIGGGGGSRFGRSGRSGRHIVQRPVTNWNGGWSRPSRPVIETPHEITHYDPWTGAVHTRNNQINDTAFDWGRNQSRNNGTRRYVNRPIRDAWGNITGYEKGWVWNNSLTGQEHGETTIVRLNGTGGTSQTNVVRSVAPGTSTTRHTYGSVAPGTSTTTVQRNFTPMHSQITQRDFTSAP